MSIGLDELGYDERLYILAFDHRGSFEKMVGDVDRVPGAKTLIWEGFQRAVEHGAPKEFAGVLVDAQYGPSVAATNTLSPCTRSSVVSTRATS